MKFIFPLFFVLIFPSFTLEFHAQAPDSQKSAKKSKTLINVPVVVSDREGHYISDLKKEDFSVFQDGVRQEIVSFATEEEPVSIALLLDTSQSTEKVLGKIKESAKDFIKLLNPQDKCLLATFDSQLSVLSQFTSDQPALENAVDNIKIGGKVGTVMRHAISKIIQSSFATVKGRKALIVLTDGKDFGSYMTKSELLDLLQESDIMVYTVFFKTGLDFVNPDGTIKQVANAPAAAAAPQKQKKKKKNAYTLQLPDGDFPTEEEIKLRERKDDLEAIDTLKKMSDITAGRFYLRDVTNLRDTFAQITNELRNQYRLTYYSTENVNNKSVYDIKIKVERPELVVRTREGFRPNPLQP